MAQRNLSSLKIIALVPMRHHSERVPGRNYRPLAGKPLYHHILTTLKSVPELDSILVDTDRVELEHSGYKYCLLVGKKLLDGNGTGKDLETGIDVLRSESYYVMEKLASVRVETDCFLRVFW